MVLVALGAAPASCLAMFTDSTPRTRAIWAWSPLGFWVELWITTWPDAPGIARAQPVSIEKCACGPV